MGIFLTRFTILEHDNCGLNSSIMAVVWFKSILAIGPSPLQSTLRIVDKNLEKNLQSRESVMFAKNS